MTRARATALALVNWKGVFYERYKLDRHVTALEGANGAGKTTVMIAAYVVLLPDMTRLRFTNVGESGATGGDRGIWGRLGLPGRPSYAAMEVALGGGPPIIAGVHLERKGEPTVALTPFLIQGASEEQSRRDMWLAREGDDESVPTLAELRVQVTAKGATIQVFASAKEYFAALFDLGVNPLRMATDEDRNKLNDLLRTSMGGGISRALTTELRGFVLREETGLGEALSRMRANLDACHRTRLEVSEAGRLHAEVSGVYDAGQAMFSAAMLSIRRAAEEQRARAQSARNACDDARESLRAIDVAEAEVHARQAGLQAVAEAARVEAVEARTHRDRLQAAWALAERLRAIKPELEALVQTSRDARAAQNTAASARALRAAAREAARERYERAAAGLAHWQRGLEELHRNAHAFRRARAAQDLVRKTLGELEIAEPAEQDESGIRSALSTVMAELRVVDLKRARIDRDAQSLLLRREDYEAAWAALTELAPDAAPTDAHGVARRVLAELADMESASARVPEWLAERERAGRGAVRQASARARANALGVSGEGARGVGLALDLAEAEVRSLEEAARTAELDASHARRLSRELRAKAGALEVRAGVYGGAVSALRELESAAGQAIAGREDLARVRVRWTDARDEARGALGSKRERLQAVVREASELSSSSHLHPELASLAQELEGELLALRFEDLSPESAAAVQAELGVLADALVVNDPRAAAAKLTKLPRTLDTVWLVAAGGPLPAALDRALRAESGEASDRVVEEALGVRVTRIPDRPTLGRRARERRAGELEADRTTLAEEVSAAALQLSIAEAHVRLAERLGDAAAALEAGDPQPELDATRFQASAADAQSGEAEDRARAFRERGNAERPRIEGLRTLLADAFLLDAPDFTERERELALLLEKAGEAQRRLRATDAPRRTLALSIESLRRAPPAKHAEEDPARLEARRASLFAVREALEELLAQPGALQLEHAERALSEAGQRTSVPESLEAQLAAARAELAIEEDGVRSSEAAWEASTSRLQQAEAEEKQRRAHHDHLARELQSREAAFVSECALAIASETVEKLAATERAALSEERRLATEAALARERRTHAERALRVAEEAARADAERCRPRDDEWARAIARAEGAGVLADADAARGGASSERTSEALLLECDARAEVLLDRLRASRGGAECVDAVRAGRATGPGRMEACIDAFVVVRDWVKRRLPAQLANVGRPLEGLDRLRSHLRALEETLTRQEAELRGASADLARGIDVQLRRAATQVRRLSASLHGVRFGSVVGIRVQLRRVERMTQVLGALREGAVQELLFQPTLPIEEALDEVFRRHGGGRGGGRRLLDYREYVELAVEIQRHTGDPWEPASPTRLSTGEAIGVGSALIMVILGEWERSEALLGPKRAGGTLRFLLLDEANRLSQDNLAVLFELCRNLDVQLLIAAPEVARSEGNTTYRLVRRVDEQGREEVLVSGRRAVSGATC